MEKSSGQSGDKFPVHTDFFQRILLDGEHLLVAFTTPFQWQR